MKEKLGIILYIWYNLGKKGGVELNFHSFCYVGGVLY